MHCQVYPTRRLKNIRDTIQQGPFLELLHPENPRLLVCGSLCKADIKKDSEYGGSIGIIGF